MDVDEIKVVYHSDSRKIGNMKSELLSGKASFWHWDTLVHDFISLYRKARQDKDFGMLLPETPMIGEKTIFELMGSMSQGGYNKESLLLLIDMYAVLRVEFDITGDVE